MEETKSMQIMVFTANETTDKNEKERERDRKYMRKME